MNSHGLSRRTADGHAIELDGWNANAYRNGLSVFTARAHALIQLQVVANHGYLGECIGTVANQAAILEWRGDLAIFHQIRLRSGKHELTVRDIHLASTKINRVDTAFH